MKIVSFGKKLKLPKFKFSELRKINFKNYIIKELFYFVADIYRGSSTEKVNITNVIIHIELVLNILL